MNLDSLRNAVTQAADFLASAMSWLAPDQADGATGLLLPALAGIATAVVLALILAVYARAAARSFQDVIRHGIAVAVGLGLLAFVAYDIHNAAHADLAKTSMWTATEFELHWQKATIRAKELAAEMAHRG